MCGTTDALTNAWHDVSRPFVDTSLGRMATNVATGGMSAPAFAAYDISHGADPLKAAAGGAMGYFGGQAGNDWLSGANAPTAAGMSEQMGDWTPGALDNPEVAANLGTSVPGQGGNTGAPPTAAGMSEQMGDWTPSDNFTPLSELGAMGSSSPAASPLASGMNEQIGDFTPSGTQPNQQGGWLSRMGTSATKAMGDAWSPEGIGKSLGTMGPMAIGSGLMDMFAKSKQAGAQKDRFNQVQQQINGTYAPGSPEYEALMQQLSRTDAAAGRNSQIGPRSTDLAAKIAQIKMNALSGTLGNQNTMFNDSLTNSGGGLGSLFAQWQKANTPRPAPAPTYNIYQQGQ
jgi:hypothetical protein